MVLTGAPIIVHGCHCRICQRMSGSAFAVNALIESDRLSLLGETGSEPVHTPSALPEGRVAQRCPRCRVALWTHPARLGTALAAVHTGSLDEGDRLAPDVHCFTATKQSSQRLERRSDRPAVPRSCVRSVGDHPDGSR